MFIVCSCKRIKHFKRSSVVFIVTSDSVQTLLKACLNLVSFRCFKPDFDTHTHFLFLPSTRIDTVLHKPQDGVEFLETYMYVLCFPLAETIDEFCQIKPETDHCLLLFPWLARGADYRKNALHNKRLNKNQTMYLYHFLEE